MNGYARAHTLVMCLGLGLGCSFSPLGPDAHAEHCSVGGTVCAEGMACSTCEPNNHGCVAPETVSVECQFHGSTTGDGTTTSPTTAPTTTSASTSSPTSLGESTSSEQDTTSTGPDTSDPETTATSNTTGTECNPDEGMAGCGTPEPYCTLEGDCVACSELDCMTLDREKPACDPDSGLCVECVDNSDCMDAEPFCDIETATCNTCTEHEQCPLSACNLDSGECLPEDNVIYVENTPGSCSDAPGNEGHDEGNPICRLSIALTRVTPDKAATIKVKQGQSPQEDSNTVPSGVTLAIIRNGNLPVALAREGAEPALNVSGGSHVFVYRIAAFSPTKGLTTRLIACDGNSSLWLDRLGVYDGKTGVFAEDCMLHIRRSTVFQNTTGGIDLTTTLTMTKLWLANSYVTDNGDVFGIRAAKNSYLDIVYSTIAANTKTVPVAQIACTAVQSDNMRLRNSLLADNQNMYFTGCEQAVQEDDLTNYSANMLTTLQDLVDAGVAVSFSGGVVRAKPNGPLAGVAVWKQGDPAIDYDMNVRPDVDGAPDYAGADVP